MKIAKTRADLPL